MERPKTFQIVIISVFVVLIVLGFLAFSDKLPLPSGNKDVSYGAVTMWGTIPAATMQKLIGDVVSRDQRVSIRYTEKKADTLNSDFVEALASGDGPDLVLVSQDNILKTLDKLSIIPYTAMTEGSFRTSFLPEGQMFLRPDGIIALPFTIDPLVMYWNRDLFTNALVVAPPSLWTQFYNLVPKITVRDTNKNIVHSLVSFGEYANVTHAKEVLSLLLMQAGSSIVNTQNGALTAALVVANTSGLENPVMSAVRFYTEFSNSSKDAYSWNPSLPDSRTMFEQGNLALYFGYASEYQAIQQKNPHLNFDVTLVPQADQSPTKITFGKMQGLAVVKASKNPQGALYAAILLSSKDVIAPLTALTGLPPVRNDLIVARPTDNAAHGVFYDSAIISRAWYDPSPSETNTIFATMLDSITSGRIMISEALTVAQGGMGRLLQRYVQQ